MQKSLAALFIMSLLLSGLLLAGTPGAAQAVAQSDDVLATCADLNVIGIPEGPSAVAAAERLRERGAPNPPGVDAALGTIVAFADFTTDQPPLASVDAALVTLNGYFGGTCNDIDRCPLVAQALSTDSAASASAAALLRKLETPSPPGIDAALALIAGEITESPFHTSIAEAQAQIESYYPCGGPEAPPPFDDVLETCADLNVIATPEAPGAIEAAENLRSRGAPNPPGIDAALDAVVAFPNSATPEQSLAAFDAAIATLDGYFGGACFDIDRCPIVVQVLSNDPTISRSAASLLGRLEQPAPPGISAGLSFIAGESDSPFHETVAEAQAQISSYYMCRTIAFTGPAHATPLAAAGVALVAAGSSLVIARRRLVANS